MMTLQEYRAMFEADRAAMRYKVQSLRAAAAVLDDIQKNDRDAGRTPAETVKAFVEAAGEEMARNVIATLINRSAWDGRIWPDRAEWAAAIPGSMDEETAVEAMISTRMHMVHLDQIAGAMMEYQPDPEPAEESADPVRQEIELNTHDIQKLVIALIMYPDRNCEVVTQDDRTRLTEMLGGLNRMCSESNDYTLHVTVEG